MTTEQKNKEQIRRLQEAIKGQEREVNTKRILGLDRFREEPCTFCGGTISSDCRYCGDEPYKKMKSEDEFDRRADKINFRISLLTLFALSILLWAAISYFIRH